ncbi:sigma factor-like helix-turn-helix DNA-binding protein [Streptomyces sp. CoH27]|uniref:sigma factor-like helix-turn-helix DNA-binding protein n=1 Tax=Streptomyces sp. CoH27 TaxID=2875763 RepID=UPI001CD63492|nr:sigma factor-like helix-turn-helix DNA-binding protein [Streptomyces sp. CoH27]
MSRSEEFDAVRPLLFSLAHRILGSTGDAEDAIEETRLRYESAPAVPAPATAFLSAEVVRVSWETLRAARSRQDEYAGPWFAGPPPADPFQDPDRPPEPAESLSTAAVLLLERLSPLERAVFVLREILGCDIARTASAVGCSEAACHQLAASVTARSDAGGEARPWPGYIAGADQSARLLAAIVPALLRVGVTMRPADVAAGPGAVFHDHHGTFLGALALDILDGRIQTVRRVPEAAGEAA